VGKEKEREYATGKKSEMGEVEREEMKER